MTAVVPVGVVHGRFQPLHNEHVEYIVDAADRCDELIVAITNPDPRSLRVEATAPERHLPEANPFTFYERMLMLHAVLDSVLGGRGVRVVPFPISHPDCWDSYVPREATHYLRVLSPWGREKARRLRAASYRVEELLPGPNGKTVSGAAVRTAMRAGDAWEELVPREVAAVIGSLGGRA